MLTSLYIKNLAVIEEMKIDFEKGMTVLTGETGAGKSILIDAFFAILGLRVSKECIRKNEKSMFVEASFYFEYYDKKSSIADYITDNTLIISREIFQDGRNNIRINGRTGNTAVLRELALYLISIHSQSDNQRIFDPQMHYKYLDIYGNTTELYQEYKVLYDEYISIKSQINDAKASENTDLGQIEYLKFLKKEIEDANIGENEEQELKEIKQAMKEVKAFSDASQSAMGALYENELSAYNLLEEAISHIRRFDKLDFFSEKLIDIKDEVSKISDEIYMEYRNISDELNEKYSDINQVEERLNEIYILKNKYGGTVESMFNRLENANNELYNLENRENMLSELNLRLEDVLEKLDEKSQELSRKRQKNAVFLSKAVEFELHELMMPNGKFFVSLTPCDEFSKYGAEKVEFLFSANLGMDLQPLSKIASGGEISRVNLAIKTILYNIDPACAFVFDEIDVGISGRAAQKIAEKLYGISSKNQILCVTHLPQIAAMADNHLFIQKNEEGSSTKTTIRKLEGKDRAKEIARIISGVTVTDLTLKNAEETLELAEKYKEEKE